MTQGASILYAEDDVNLAMVTRDHLEMNGYEVTLVQDGNAAMQMYQKGEFSIIILDVAMPGLTGFEVAEKIREHDADTPIIFLTAKSQKEDRIQGLKTGADDYIVKPYSIEELILKIQVFLKRSGNNKKPGADGNYQLGKYLFKSGQQRLLVDGQERVLTHKESEVLKILCQRKNQVVKREEILTPVWGNDDYFNGRSLDVFVSKLRKYLAEDQTLEIINIHSVGFKLLEKIN
jgi:DNA-binding response OmpR family regulator